MTVGQIVSGFDKLWAGSADRNWIPARLGVRTSSSTYLIDVVGRPNRVWVSLGTEGELGQAEAIDALGVARVGWTYVRLRREHGDLVIREVPGGVAGAGGGGGSSSLAGLTDVAIASQANGQVLTWSGPSSKWINATISPTGTPYVPGNGIDITGATISTRVSAAGGISYSSGNLEIKKHDPSGLTITSSGVRVGQGNGINVGTSSVAVQVATPDSGLQFVGGGIKVGAGNGLTVSGDTLSVNVGMGLEIVADAVAVNLKPHSALEIDGDGLSVDGVIAGAGLSWDDTFKIMSVNVGEGLMWEGDYAAVNEDYAFNWTNVHTWAETLLVINPFTYSLAVDTNLIYADTLNNRVGINQVPGNAALDIKVSALADHSQRLKRAPGQTGRLWRVEDTDGSELIVLDSQGNLQSGRPGFVSGLTGWQIQPNGTAEFNNVWVRGELHATVFVKDEIHATGGTILVASAGKLEHDLTIDLSEDREELDIETTVAGFGDKLTIESTSPTWTGTTLELEAILNYIDIEDPPSGPGFYFQPGDVVRSKTEVPNGVTDIWLEITSATQWEGYARYGFITRKSGFYNFIPAGAAVVSYGQPGDGRIMITSDLNYAPYLDVFTVGPEVWTGNAGSIIPHVRLGRLDGVGVTGTSGIRQYGIIAGTDLSDANSPYAILSNLQMRLHKVNYTANNGTNDTVEITADGNLTLGSNIGVPEGKSFQVISTGDDAGDVIIGRLSGNYLRWDQQSATLTVNGNILIGGSAPASVEYVDANDLVVTTAAAADATEKAGLAYSAAYTNATTDAAADATTKAGNAYSAAYTNATTDAAADATAKANAAQAAAISAAGVSADAYADAHRLAGVTGVWTSLSHNTVQWQNVHLRLASGVNKQVNPTSGVGSSGALTGMNYFHVDPELAAPLTMSITNNFDAIPAGNVLVAVVTPAPTSGTGFWATINVLGGATWISGDQIVTGSIKAAQIVAASITTDRLAADVFITTGNQAAALDAPIAATASDAADAAAAAQGTATTANATANTAQSAAATVQGTANTAVANAATAQLTAETLNSYRAIGVDGPFASTDIDTVSWGDVVVRKANGTTIAIFGGNTGNMTTTTWLYIPHSATSPTTMQMASSVAALPANAIIVGVATPGTAVASGGSGLAGFLLLPGRTLITGDQIVTGSIVANNIRGGTITGDKIAGNQITAGHILAGEINATHISGTTLSAVATDTGSLTVTGALQVGTSGQIYSSGAGGSKSSCADDTPGFFLGWDLTPFTPAHTFAVGDATNYLRWDGDNLAIKSTYPVDLTGDAEGDIFAFHDLSGHHGGLRLFSDGTHTVHRFLGSLLASNGYVAAPLLWADNQSITSGEVLRFSMAGGAFKTMTLNVVGSGILGYDGGFHATSTISTANRFIQDGNIFQIKGSFKPANSSASGETGQFSWDGAALYICVAPNTWRRTTIEPF